MKKSKFSESQIVAILAEGEAGVPVAQVLRTHGISHATYYNWKSKYGGTSVAELKRLNAYFSPSWTVISDDRGRQFSGIVDAVSG